MTKSLIRFLKGTCLTVLLSNLMFAQTSTQSSTSATDKTDVGEQLKHLQDAMTQQQQQITLQQQEIEKLRQQVANQKTDATPQVVDATLHTAATNPAAQPASDMMMYQEDKPKESPLSFKIGGADFTPGGFVDFENIFRTTNTGNVSATSFGSIPFSNTVAGHLTEFRMTGQYSRLNLKVTDKFGENNVTGFVEADFNGNDAGNVFVQSNGHTFRLRHYWMDLRRGNWEFLGGQVWGMMTANRFGVSPISSDVFTTLNEDGNHNVGNNFTRAAQFRVAYHFNNNFVWAAGIENPQQYTNGEVVFPTAFNAQLGVQLDSGANPGTPNVAPDVVSKLAYDSDKKRVHLELGGLLTTVKITDLPTVLGATFNSHGKAGGGVEAGFNVEVFKNFHLLGNGLWGPGVGRYLGGLAPDAVVVPVPATTGTGFDTKVSMVHSGDALVGFEAQLTPKTQVGGYYGGMFAKRNYATDITAAANPLGFRPYIGFGFPAVINPATGIPQFGGSGNNNNRAVQEGTIDWIQTFWKSPQHGSLLLVTQYSYLVRSPWFVAAGAPKNAHLSMVYMSLKYVLP